MNAMNAINESPPPPEVVEASKARPECSVAVEKSTRISFQSSSGTKETKQNWYLLCPSEPRRSLIHSESNVVPITKESSESSLHTPLLGDIWRSILRKERQSFHDGSSSSSSSSSMLERSKGSHNSGSISVWLHFMRCGYKHCVTMLWIQTLWN